jgi:hypothetical protein
VGSTPKHTDRLIVSGKVTELFRMALTETLTISSANSITDGYYSFYTQTTITMVNDFGTGAIVIHTSQVRACHVTVTECREM